MLRSSFPLWCLLCCRSFFSLNFNQPKLNNIGLKSNMVDLSEVMVARAFVLWSGCCFTSFFFWVVLFSPLSFWASFFFWCATVFSASSFRVVLRLPLPSLLLLNCAAWLPPPFRRAVFVALLGVVLCATSSVWVALFSLFSFFCVALPSSASWRWCCRSHF